MTQEEIDEIVGRCVRERREAQFAWGAYNFMASKMADKLEAAAKAMRDHDANGIMDIPALDEMRRCLREIADAEDKRRRTDDVLSTSGVEVK